MAPGGIGSAHRDAGLGVGKRRHPPQRVVAAAHPEALAADDEGLALRAPQAVIGVGPRIAPGTAHKMRLADAQRRAVMAPGGDALGLDTPGHPPQLVVGHARRPAPGVALRDQLAERVAGVGPAPHVGVAHRRLAAADVVGERGCVARSVGRAGQIAERVAHIGRRVAERVGDLDQPAERVAVAGGDAGVRIPPARCPPGTP